MSQIEVSLESSARPRPRPRPSSPLLPNEYAEEDGTSGGGGGESVGLALVVWLALGLGRAPRSHAPLAALRSTSARPNLGHKRNFAFF